MLLVIVTEVGHSEKTKILSVCEFEAKQNRTKGSAQQMYYNRKGTLMGKAKLESKQQIETGNQIATGKYLLNTHTKHT